jgi:hypothetical protein
VTLGLIALAAVVLVPLATAGHQPKCPVLNVRCLRPRHARRRANVRTVSARRRDRAADRLGRCPHPFVVGHDSGEVASELLGGCKMDSVEASQFGREERAGGKEDPVGDADQLQPRQDLVAAPGSAGTNAVRRAAPAAASPATSTHRLITRRQRRE